MMDDKTLLEYSDQLHCLRSDILHDHIKGI